LYALSISSLKLLSPILAFESASIIVESPTPSLNLPIGNLATNLASSGDAHERSSVSNSTFFS